VPRYQNFYAPAGSVGETGNGEFNIGYNPKTGRIMAMNSGPIMRITPPEVQSPGKPESCEALWEDKSSTVTDVGLDPILWTDQKSGRTIASNSTVGANADYAYTDNDGDLWVPIGIGPPDGGADHQTISTGPFPASQALLATPLNQGQNTMYCSQDIVGPAACQRSLDLGMTWGPGVLAYTGNGPQQCGGLHGHMRIAPDGTEWLPVNQCGGKQGGVVSTDGGLSFTEFAVTGSTSQAQGADPSIGIDSDNTAYLLLRQQRAGRAGRAVRGPRARQGQQGPRPHLDQRLRPRRLARHQERGAHRGDRRQLRPRRVRFHRHERRGRLPGHRLPGRVVRVHRDHLRRRQELGHRERLAERPGAARERRVAAGRQPHDRNLLDFNEITTDSQGRVLYGYSDGCVSAGCKAGTSANDFVADMRVARQTGGKSLFAQFDATEPVAPKRACLSGTRDATGTRLNGARPTTAARTSAPTRSCAARPRARRRRSARRSAARPASPTARPTRRAELLLRGEGRERCGHRRREQRDQPGEGRDPAAGERVRASGRGRCSPTTAATPARC
jgi:hypothetical protein